ncbi:hypothetical protein [Maridesulfovibrio sp.]|uniref:hypothetical protein n=1 Tax=Maridesulfovibrio sp. TaxID=2795000 RepID=UPI002AA5E92E|nr:hypothetical protein [Maridesulfovibrio sp.]
MKRYDLKNWKGIIQSVKGPIAFFALVVLAFQVILLALVYKGGPETMNYLIFLSSLSVIIPILAVSWAFVRSSHNIKSTSDSKSPVLARKVRIFITSPMSTYKSDKEYRQIRLDLMSVVNLLRRCEFVDDVFFFNERFESLESFENADLNVPEYFHKINQCDYFVLIVADRQFSSIHFESGFALAKEKKAIYFVHDSDCLPFLTKLAVFAYPHTIRSYEFSSFNEIGKILCKQESYI